MKFINTGEELLCADCIESVKCVETVVGKRNREWKKWKIIITTISDNYYYYNPDHNEKMTLTEAEYIMDALVAELEADG